MQLQLLEPLIWEPQETWLVPQQQMIWDEKVLGIWHFLNLAYHGLNLNILFAQLSFSSQEKTCILLNFMASAFAFFSLKVLFCG